MAAVTVITPDLPHPPTAGGKIKSHLLLRCLTAAHDVSLVTVLKGDDAEHRAGITDALELREILDAPVERGRGIVNLAKSIVARKTLNEYRTWSPDEDMWKEWSGAVQNSDGRYSAAFARAQRLPGA